MGLPFAVARRDGAANIRRFMARHPEVKSWRCAKDGMLHDGQPSWVGSKESGILTLSSERRRRPPAESCHRSDLGVLCGLTLARLPRLPSLHPLRQRQPDTMAGHGVPTIEVGEHEGRRICVGHDHLRNQGREDRQQNRPRSGAGECRNLTGRASSEMRSRSRPSAGASTIGPGQRSRQSRRDRLNRSKFRWGQ